MEIANRVVIVTGGSSGLGAATARGIVAAGAKVVIADLQAGAGQALADELGPAARFSATDVTSGEQVAATVELAQREFGSVDGLVCCAGILAGSRVLTKQGAHDLALFEKIIQVNLIGTFNCLRLAAAAMANNAPDSQGERGVIVMTSSVAAFEGQIGQAAYSASKGGVASMVLPLARDLARHGIRAVAIAPGVMATPMAEGLSDELRASLESQVPFPSRLGDPAEFAALARHIFENRYLNGSVLRLDGAVRMGPK